VLLFAWAIPAAADLYRWVDPETGSVKFSSYAPPWFGDAAKQKRGPKVEVIPAGKPAAAFEPAPEADRDRAAPPDADAPRADRRAALLKQLQQRVGALIAAAPEAAERAFVEISESLQQLDQLEKQSKTSNPKAEDARLEEKFQLAVPLEAHRLALSQRISGLRPPPPGSSPEAIANAWRGVQVQLSALDWTSEALNAMDPRKLNARHFEMRALTERVNEMWESYVGRRNLGR
jgi:uncharacterized membrane protein YccC